MIVLSSNALVPVTTGEMTPSADDDAKMFVTFYVSGQMFGLEVTHVHEIFFPEAIYRVPMAPRQVAGLINLRGRIVTVIDMRDKLSLDEGEDDRSERRPSITTDKDGELYSLWIDKIGDILEVAPERLRPVPPTVSANWRQVARAVCQLDGALLIVLDLDALLADATSAARAA